MATLIYSPVFWIALASACLIEGILLILGKAKFLSMLYYSENKENLTPELLRKEGAASIVFGLVVIIDGVLAIKVSLRAAMILLFAALAVYVVYILLLSRELKNADA